jgi:hypothetical protein
MGLGLEVGILADLKSADEEGYKYFSGQFSRINTLLAAKRLGQHCEPEEVDELFSCSMIGYSGLHYLRRIAMHIVIAQSMPPPGTRDNYMAEDIGREYYLDIASGEDLEFQHLVMHSDAEGFYIPVDFMEVIDSPDILGEYLGSTHRLREECKALAAALEIPASLSHESTALFTALDRQLADGQESKTPVSRGQAEPRWQSYAVETHACLHLLAACEVSLRNKAAIVFC